MGNVFWDETGVFLFDFMKRRTTKLRRTIKNLLRKKLSSGIIFLHDNVSTHTATRTKEKIQHFSYELFDHSELTLHLAFPLFALESIGGGWFVDAEELKIAAVN